MIIVYAMGQDRAPSFENKLGGRGSEMGVAVAGWIQARVSFLGGNLFWWLVNGRHF